MKPLFDAAEIIPAENNLSPKCIFFISHQLMLFKYQQVPYESDEKWQARFLKQRKQKISGNER